MFLLPELKPDEVLIYLRKSRTDDPALSVSETVAKHEQMLDDYSMRTWGTTIPEQNRFREVVSGETIEARPEIQKVLRLIEQDRFKAILIVEPQRLSRGDLEDIGKLSKLLRYTGTIVITLQYSYDLSDERDRDYFERELKRGNEYLEYSKRIMTNGRILSCERGHYIASREPYGYKKVFRKDGNRKYPTLDVIQSEAHIIRMIFSMYANGDGATKICTHLNAIGCLTKQGNVWTPPCIYPILDNPLYIGKIKWGKRKEIKTVECGEIVMSRPINKEYPLFDGVHEAIISEQLWDAVRTRREAASIPRAKISRDLQNPLSGIIYCICGHAMIRRPYSGRCADRIQCPNQTYCNNASSTMQEMLEIVSGALIDAIDDFKVHLNEGDSLQQNHRVETLRILQDRMNELEKKEISLWDKYAEDEMPKRIFDKLIEKVTAQKSEISRKIAETEAEPQPIDFESKIVTFSEAVSAINNPDVPKKETNELLKSCISKITYCRERGHREPGTTKKGGWIVNPIQVEITLNL